MKNDSNTTEVAILRQLLAETLRVYEEEAGLPSSSGSRSAPKNRRSRQHITRLRGFGLADLRSENAVLRRLLATTAEAYEERLVAFRAEKGLVRHLLAATSDVVATLDVSARVTSLNPMAEKLTGWATTKAQGQAVGDILKLVDDEGLAVALRLDPCFSQGSRIDLLSPLRLIHRQGESLPVDGLAAPIREGRAGKILGVVVVLRQVPERY